MSEIRAGATLSLRTGATVKVTAVINGAAYITRPDGSFPRAVALEWLASKVRSTQ